MNPSDELYAQEEQNIAALRELTTEQVLERYMRNDAWEAPNWGMIHEKFFIIELFQRLIALEKSQEPSRPV